MTGELTDEAPEVPVTETFAAPMRPLDTLAAVLDRDGRVTAHNRQWLVSMAWFGLDPAAVGVGTDYPALCERFDGSAEQYGRRAAAGIRAVLAGERAQFRLDYPWDGPDGRRWFTLRVAQVAGPASGALVSHADITATRDAEEAIRGQRHELWSMADVQADFVVLADDEGRVIRTTCESSALPSERYAAAVSPMDVVHPADRERAQEAFERCLAIPDGRATITARALRHGEGEWGHFEVDLVNRLADPEVEAVVVSGRDLTEPLRAASDDLLAARLMDELPISAVATDDAGIVVSVSPGAARMLGREPEAILGRAIGDFAGALTPEVSSTAEGAVAAHGMWVGELDVRRWDGVVIPAWVKIRRIHDPVTGFEGRAYLALDHTEERRLRDSLFHRDRHDPLTGLPNRYLFLARVHEMAANIDGAPAGAVAVVSLDAFHEVNTRYGAEIGDRVLHRVGSVLRRSAGTGSLTARLYGDVFGVAVTADRDLDALGEELRSAVSAIEPVEGIEVAVRASIGLRMVEPGDDADAVVDDAVAASGAAKKDGGHRCRAYDLPLRSELEERMVFRQDLKGAVARGEMVVDYQPVVRLDDGSVVGAEALVRWEHPTRGRIAPDRFIPLSEQTSVIHEISTFVLEDVCQQAVRWRDLRPESPMRVAVNLSMAQLGDSDLPRRVRAALARYHLDPGSITLELTESMLMDEAGVAMRRLAELKAVGVRMAVDDFGTGYSSLARLKHLPLDVVKIDRSFVADAGGNPEDTAIVRTIVGLAEAFGVDVIAEGVETLEDGRALREAGCTVGQGFVWSPPVPATEIDAMLHRPFACMPSPTTGADAVDRLGAYTDALRTIQHELATPLAVLNAAVSQHDEQGQLRPDVHDLVVRGVLRVSRLVASLDLLDRLDRGTLTVSPTEQDLAELVREAVREVRTHAGGNFEVLAPAELRGWFDGTLVAQVVVNLLSNAVKYSPEGTQVVVRAGSRTGEVFVEVRDTGPGIPADRVGTIWRKFGRLDHSVPGSGIGLYLARGIARAHGGDLRYRAGDPCGSVFVLELPGPAQSGERSAVSTARS